MPNSNIADISTFETLQYNQNERTGQSQMSVFNGKVFADGDNVIATAGSLDGIKRMVKQYYMGEDKELKSIGGDKYQVLKASGQPIDGVLVKKVKGRFRFVDV